MDNQNLKDAVAEVIKANGVNAITGKVLQDALISIINQFGANRQFAGFAIPTTVPGNPDANVFYLASLGGIYANFAGINIKDGDLYALYNDSGWKSTKLFSLDFTPLIGASTTNLPLNDISTSTVYSLLTDGYVNKFDASSARSYNRIKIKINTAGVLQLIKLSSDLTTITQVGEISVSAGINDVSFNSITVQAGELLGVRNGPNPVGIYYNASTGVGFYTITSSGILNANKEIAYELYGAPVFDPLSKITLDIKKIITDISTLSGAPIAKTYSPNIAFASMPSNGGSTRTYINKFISSISIENLKTVQIYCTTAGTATIIKSNNDFTNRVDIQAVNLVVGLNTFNVNTILEIGQRVGLKLGTASIKYSAVNGVGAWDSSGGEFVSGLELGYSYTTGSGTSSLSYLTNKTAELQQKITSIESGVIGEDGVKSYIPSIPLTSAQYTSNSYPGTLYANKFADSLFGETVKTLSVFVGVTAGTIEIYKMSNDFKTTQLVLTVQATAGINEFTNLDIFLLAGERIGIRAYMAVRYRAAGGVGIWAGDSQAFAPNLEIAYGYTTLAKAINLSEIANLANQNKSELSLLKTKKVGLISVFKDLFTTSNNWTFTGWVFTSGKFASSAIGVNNRLELPIMYHFDKRIARAVFKLGADTDLRIHIKYGAAGLANGEGASMFGINASTKKITLYKVAGSTPDVTSTGVTETMHAETLIPFDIIAGRNYIIEIEKNSYTNSVKLIDTVSGATAVCSSIGWATGRQNQFYGFYVASGSGVELYDFSVYSSMSEIDLYIEGDSITEGVMVLDKSKRWAEELRTLIPKTIISARGGSNIDDIIKKFDTEIKYLRPKALMILIGANGGNTVAKIQQIIDLCVTYNIKLYWNYNTCQQAGDAHIALNNMIAPFKLPGCRFDIATALNNIPTVDGVNTSPRYNPSLYYDAGLHPNTLGNIEMVKRFAIDIPELKA